MELWIRSQDKTELVKVNNLANIDYRIVFINNGNGRVTLGTYKSKERALEVLDEIQKIIAPRGIIKQDKKGIELTMIDVPQVYEMPEE